jgi:hypothetical protein
MVLKVFLENFFLYSSVLSSGKLGNSFAVYSFFCSIASALLLRKFAILPPHKKWHDSVCRRVLAVHIFSFKVNPVTKGFRPGVLHLLIT